MRALLDTHTLIWALTEPDRLAPDALAIVSSRQSDLVVSAATAWELATKVRLGKLPGAERIVDTYAGHLERLGAAELPIASREALFAGSLPWQHRDPFDRVLAAQAMLGDLVLLTKDPVFDELIGLKTRW